MASMRGVGSTTPLPNGGWFVCRFLLPAPRQVCANPAATWKMAPLRCGDIFPIGVGKLPPQRSCGKSAVSLR